MVDHSATSGLISADSAESGLVDDKKDASAPHDRERPTSFSEYPVSVSKSRSTDFL